MKDLKRIYPCLRQQQHDLISTLNPTKMGIKGLTSFLDDNSQLLTSYFLRDTKVVIDGNNLFHFLNTLYDVRDNFGGNYDCFAAATMSFFAALAECNVEPVVVFDGPYNPREKKINTAVKRAKDRIHIAYNLSVGCRGRATPILSQDVFVSILEDIGVDHVTGDEEADPEIAALAKMYNCPVMTNDSDFFIFNLPAGTILLDYVNIQVTTDQDSTRAPETSPKYISVQIYYVHKLHELFKMETDMFALFGTILGNDTVDIKTLDPFFAGVHLPKSRSDRMFSGQKQTRILGVLLWLESMGTLDCALKKILHCYEQDRRENLKEALMGSINNYLHIDQPKTRSLDVKRYDSTILTYNGHTFPDWFLKNLRGGKVMNLTSNAAVSRKVMLHAQPENFSLPSAHCCAMQLRRVIYGVVLQHDKQYHEHYGDAGNCTVTCASKESQSNLYIEEVDRDLKNQKRNLVEPTMSLSGEPIPSLAQMPQVNIEERLSLLRLAHGVKPGMLLACPHKLDLYIMTVIYWINHSQPKVDLLHLNAITIGLLKLTLLDPPLADGYYAKHPLEKDWPAAEDTPISHETLREMIMSQNINLIVANNCSRISITAAKEKLDKFLLPVESKCPASQLDLNTLHIFAQLQTCILASQALNQVLGAPVDRIPVQEVYNGAFLYCFYNELKSRTKPEAYIAEVLNRCPVLNGILNTLMDVVKSSLEPNVLISDIEPGKRKSKKRKKSVKKECVQDASLDDEVPDTQDDQNAKLIAKCDVTNRFECLLLED